VKCFLIDQYVKKQSGHGMSTFNGSSVSSNPIVEELKIVLKGLTQGIKTKICQNDLVPMWHHFGSKFSWSYPTKILHTIFKTKLVS
jgi:hypothetical protein